MGAIKRNITDISNLKRGAVQMSKVYRGANLIWSNAPSTSTKWLTNGLNLILDKNEAGENVYVTSGLNIKLK